MILTVDFEAFDPSQLPIWRDAMEHWARRAREAVLPFAFFVSTEDGVRTRASNAAFDHLRAGFQALEEAGSTFYLHNHGVFDPATGLQTTSPAEPSRSSLAYSKRKSFFYDVVHRRRLDPGLWLRTLRGLHDEVLSAAGCSSPRRAVFRAGGWDYGSSCEELRAYVDALTTAGLGVDSSACRGVYGTESWRIGAEVGSNLFRLRGGLLEVAPCHSLDCGAEPASLAYLDSLFEIARGALRAARRGGALVLVLHFDHLFHARGPGPLELFAVVDKMAVRRRIDRLFRLLRTIRVLFGLNPAGFDDVGGWSGP